MDFSGLQRDGRFSYWASNKIKKTALTHNEHRYRCSRQGLADSRAVVVRATKSPFEQENLYHGQAPLSMKDLPNDTLYNGSFFENLSNEMPGFKRGWKRCYSAATGAAASASSAAASGAASAAGTSSTGASASGSSSQPSSSPHSPSSPASAAA